jgi:hypothetical protein
MEKPNNFSPVVAAERVPEVPGPASLSESEDPMTHSDIASASWLHIKQVAFAWIDTISHVRRPAAVPVGLGVTFLLVCRRFGLEPRRVLEISERTLRRAADVEPQYPRAISAYLESEVRDGSA